MIFVSAVLVFKPIKINAVSHKQSLATYIIMKSKTASASSSNGKITFKIEALYQYLVSISC